MRTLITHLKWRWILGTVLTTVLSFAALLLLNASSPPSGKPTAKADTTKSAPTERQGIHVASAAFTFSAPIKLARPQSPIFFQQGGEPEIKIDIYGNIYVTAIQGVPGGVDLWKSVNNGGTFTYLGQPDGAQDHCPDIPQCVALGGGDDSIDVSPGGYFYVSSLWAGNVTVSTSFDGGVGGAAPGQAWQVNGAAASIIADDRQWVAAYGPETLYMTYRQAPGVGALFAVKSTDAGMTFGPPALVKTANSTEGNLVVDPYNGNLYTTTVPAATPTNIQLLKSTDAGATWVETTAYAGAPGSNPARKFTILAIDRGGNLHLVFSRLNPAGGGTHAYLSSSTNGGTSWLPAVQIDSGSGNTTTAVMPWVVAGSAGVVNITWLGSAAATPDTPSNWQLFFAQSTNALSGSPIFNQVQVSTNPVHDQSICFNGTGCAGGPGDPLQNRDLLEYYTMTVDPNGNAAIAFADSVNGCDAADCITNAWFIKQTGGTSIYAPPAAPAPATFAANIGVGSPGAEPSIWVDSFNCIYITAPGQPWVWKSVNKGASFLPPTNPVADEPTLTGGDEDIISLPKQDGSHTRPDQLYFSDLGLSTCHIRKSTAEVSATDHNPVWFKPGPGGAAGDVSVSSDRQWLAGDQGTPAAGDQTIYHWEHELVTEAMRISSLVNDTAWQFTSGMTDPELVALLSSTLPNTNPGPVFVNKTTHRVFGLFNGSVPLNNALNPPFGKLLNVWEMDAAPPLNAASPVTDVQNHPVFKGTYDSPNNPPPAVGPPVGPNFGTNNANIFPAGDIDSAGNIYVVWSMNNSRTNEFSIWFASSHDNGKTYYGPFWVSSGPLTADETAVFPWVAAGDAGRVDIIWYGTTAVGDPNTLTGSPPWKLYFAQTLNGNSREPVFTVVQPNPSNIIHNGQISTGGLLGSSDRSLLDFMEVAVGPDGLANITFADNAGQATRAEYTRQLTGPVVKTNPTFPSCLPCDIQPVSAVSRKTHTGVGDFDVNLLVPPTPPPGVGIECRTGGATGDFKVVISFGCAVTVNGTPKAQVTSGTGTVSNVTVNGSVVTVDLTGVTNAQQITITLFSVNNGATTGNVSVKMGILLGDTTSNAFTNASDISQTKAQSGTVPTQNTFRTDVTINGLINASDISAVKSKSGTAFTPMP
jgi:hypothetical protein